MRQAPDDEFCLYLWRSLRSPGSFYLTRSMESLQAVYSGLVEEGYIVKAVHVGSGTEFELRDGELLPVRRALNGTNGRLPRPS
jgi:hypothetical protein